MCYWSLLWLYIVAEKRLEAGGRNQSQRPRMDFLGWVRNYSISHIPNSKFQIPFIYSIDIQICRIYRITTRNRHQFLFLLFIHFFIVKKNHSIVHIMHLIYILHLWMVFFFLLICIMLNGICVHYWPRQNIRFLFLLLIFNVQFKLIEQEKSNEKSFKY